MGGKTIWLTGLSGAGKTTIAEALVPQLPGKVTLLDGDVIRTNLSKGLGFSKEDRDTNIARIGWVCKVINYHGGIAVVAAISPYAEARRKNREMLAPDYVEVFVDCSLAECERRDVKGLYRKARSGEIKGFTGIDDPYEPPENPEVQVDTGRMSVQECMQKILSAI